MAEPIDIARIDIALGFDAAYAPHAAAAIASVVRHAPGIEVRFILLHAGVQRPQQERVESAAPGARFVWVEVGEKDLPAFSDRGHFNRAILFRIGLEQLAPADCKRVLYIDSDTTVMHDIRELWRADLKGEPVGAVIDHYNNSAEWAKKWSLPVEGARYFNSGVLLVDLEKVRAERLFSKALDFFVANDKELLFADQDALNFALWGRWTPLDPAWNVQRFMSPAEFAAQPAERQVKDGIPKLVHFIGWEKPWLPNKWHPWAWAYWQNLSRTPFAGEVRRTNHMDLFQLAKLRLRWWLKHPPNRVEGRVMSADGSIAQGASTAQQTSDVIDVAFGIDARYAPHASAVIASVVHYGKGGRYRFIVMHTGVTREVQKRIESVAPGQRFVWIEVTDDDLPPFADRDHFTRATLFRMGLEKLAPADAQKIVYLDADITLMADVRKLAAVDLEGAPAGAVHDPNVDVPAFGAKWNLDGASGYFNAGILLVDMAKVRAEGLFTKAIAFFSENHKELPWHDQDALNFALWGRWKPLDAVWNVQRSMAIATAAEKLAAEKRIDGKKPAIIHFTGGEKPWIAGAYHPWSHVYWQSLARTPFLAEVAVTQRISTVERLKVLVRYLRWWPWTGRTV